MADEKLEIKISTSYDGKGADKASKDIKNVGEISKSTQISVKSLSSALKVVNLNAFLELINKAIGSLKALGSVFAHGIDLNSQFEQMNTKLQSLIFTADKSANTDPFAKWASSGDIAKNIIDDLQNLASKTGFGSVDLSEAFASFYSTASAHLNTDEAVKVFEKLAYAAKISGADINTLKATLDNVGAGIVQTNNDFGRFLGSLGLGTEELKKAIEQGNYAELIINSLAPFQQASDMAGNSLKDLKNQFVAGIDEIQRKSAEPIFDGLKESLESLKEADLSNLQKSLTDLSETFANLLKDNLTKDNLEAFANTLSGLITIVNDLAKGISTLSDFLAPDALFGENAGAFTAINKTLSTMMQGFKEIRSAIVDFGMGGSEEWSRMEKIVNQSSDNMQKKLNELGASFENFEFKGFDKEADFGNFKGTVEALQKRHAELSKLLNEINNLTAMKKVQVNNGFVNVLINELSKVEKQLNSISGWEGIPNLINETKNAKALADETARLKMEEQTRLETYLKANETRFKNYEKTIERLMAEEEKLTQKIMAAEEERANIKTKYDDMRKGVEYNYDEQFRKAGQYNMSDTGKYVEDMKRFRQAIDEANQALANGDMSAYERALELAKAINNEWKDQQITGTTNGVEQYKSRLEELKQTELSGIDAKEAKENEAHSQKIAALQAELSMVQQNIAAEQAFHDEYLAKTQELQNLLNTPTNSEHTVNINDSEAKNAISALQEDTHSTHTVHIKEVKEKGSGTEKKATGGLITGAFRRRRGKIAGHDLTGRDDVPALLTRGEFVQNVRAVDYYGTAFLNALNRRAIPKSALPKFSTGGAVDIASAKLDKFVLNLSTGGSVTSVKKPIERTVNLNFKKANGEVMTTQTDEQTAFAIDRYLRGII